MSPRKSYKTVNVSREVVEWIDALLKKEGAKAAREELAPLGITSRDEFVRIAIAFLGAALYRNDQQEIPLDVVRRLVEQLEERRKE